MKGEVSSEEYLQDCIRLIETYMDFIEALRRIDLSSSWHIAILSVFLRTFDASSYCLRSAFQETIPDL